MTPFEQVADIGKALAHPMRVKLLMRMGLFPRRPGSPTQLMNTDDSLPLVSHHMRVLERSGHVRLVKTEPRRGAVEHFYRLTASGRRAAELALLIHRRAGRHWDQYGRPAP